MSQPEDRFNKVPAVEMNKRERRRIEREKKNGPERLITSWTPEAVTLECGHVILNPKRSQTVHMRMPKHYRCLECKKE